MNAVTALVTLRATQRLSKRDGRLEWIGYIVIDGWGVAIAIVFSLTDYYYCKRWWPCFSFLFLFVFSFIYFLLFESFLLLLRARLHWPVDSEKLMTGRLGRILYTHCRATGCSCWTRPAACSSGRSKEHFPVLDSPLSPLSLSLRPFSATSHGHWIPPLLTNLYRSLHRVWRTIVNNVWEIPSASGRQFLGKIANFHLIQLSKSADLYFLFSFFNFILFLFFSERVDVIINSRRVEPFLFVCDCGGCLESFVCMGKRERGCALSAGRDSFVYELLEEHKFLYFFFVVGFYLFFWGSF